MNIDRRSLILGGGLGLGMLMLPGGSALAAGILNAKGFTHNVASGEPGADSMLLWTRFVPAAGDNAVRLDAEVALDPAFTRVVSGGSVRTAAYLDWTAKVTVDGLEPGTVYWYRFIAPDGSKSPVGRTKTLPVGDVPRFGLGLFSCSNLPYGWFNAYAHASERQDLDLWLHVGDYIYEYGNPPASDTRALPERVLEPDHEMIALADYRLRLACYRADPDLQRLHQMAPMVALWDDHESTNDSWEGGAQNHQPETEGDWSVRRAFAAQAYREWMPISDKPWKAYTLGTLATLYRTESRLLGRTQPADIHSAFRANDPDAALKAFRDGAWQDPTATMLGSAQESWLAHALKNNARSTAWQLVGMATILGRTVMPEDTLGWLRPDASERTIESFRNNVRAARLGLPMWMDRWDGYPAARSRRLQQADADLVMLSGDSHNAWAYSLAEDGRPAGVEFAGHAVTSGGMEGSFGVDPKTVAQGFIAANAELEWADTSRRGYMMLEITPQRVTGEWVFLETIRQRSTALAGSHRMHVDRGRRAFTV
jgi:alkaline phosphatase D